MKKSKQFTVWACLIALLAVISTGSLSANENRWSFYIGAGTGQFEWDQDNDLAAVANTSILLSPVLSTGASADGFRQYQLLTFLENSQPTTYGFQETHLRLGFEYLATENKNLGLRFGISGQSGSVNCVNNCGELGLLASLTLLDAVNTGTSGSSDSSSFASLFVPLVLLDAVALDEPPEYSYYTLDFGLDWHFNPDGGVDPYLGFNMGVGTCELPVAVEGNCNIGKIGPRLGLRFNFSESFYFYTEAEYNRLHMQFSGEEGGNLTVEANAPVALLGVAYRF